jgi:hypothetical protein
MRHSPVQTSLQASLECTVGAAAYRIAEQNLTVPPFVVQVMHASLPSLTSKCPHWALDPKELAAVPRQTPPIEPRN